MLDFEWAGTLDMENWNGGIEIYAELLLMGDRAVW